MTFADKVYSVLKSIPKGKVMTYSGVAKLAGSPKAVRAVGNILGKNPYIPIVPCHRVVKSDGSVGGYAYGSKAKVKLLKSEGVVISNNKVDLNSYEYKG